MTFSGDIVFQSGDETVVVTPDGRLLYRLLGYHGQPTATPYGSTQEFSDYGELAFVQARHTVPTCCGKRWTPFDAIRERATQYRLALLAVGRTPANDSRNDAWLARFTCVNAERWSCGVLHAAQKHAPCLFAHRVLLFEQWSSQQVIGRAL